MSLLANLPLSYNLDDYGVGIVGVVESSGIGWTNPGKVYPGALSISGGKYVRMNLPELPDFYTHYSISFWVKRTGTQALWSDYFGIGLEDGTLLRMETISTSSHACNIFANGRLTSDNGVSVLTSMELNKWYHIACTIDDTYITTYVDGIQIGRYNFINAGYNLCGLNPQVYIGDSSGASVNAAYNDFRVYGHCLSKTEVKRLSEGMIVDFEFNEPNGNALRNSGTFNGWTLSNYATIDNTHQIFGNNSIKISASGQTSNIYQGISLDLNKDTTIAALNSVLTPGDVVTFSVWVYTPSDNGIDIGRELRIYQTSNSGGETSCGPGLTGSSDKDKWVLWKATYTIRDDLSTAVLNCNIVRNGTYWISSPKIEFGTQATRWIDMPSNGNLLTRSLKAGARATISGDKQSATINWTSNAGDTYFYLLLNQRLEISRLYRLSFRASGTGSGVKFALGNKSNYTITINEGLNKYEFFTEYDLISSMSNSENELLFDDISRNTSLNSLKLYDFKLEEITNNPAVLNESNYTFSLDTSPFGYGTFGDKHPEFSNFTNIGTGSIHIETPSHTSAMIDDYSVGSGIEIKGLCYGEGNVPFTIETWFYRQSLGYQNGTLINLTDGTTNGLRIYGNNIYLSNGSSSAYITRKDLLASLNTWNHYVIVYTGTTLLQYLNGVSVLNADLGLNFGELPWDYLRLGYMNDCSGTAYNFHGYFSRVRFYTTALSATRIKELYEVKQKIDKNGNIFSQFKEEAPRNLLDAWNLDTSKVGRYTQSNCQAEVHPLGIKIIRPYNVLCADSGGSNTMWGGIRIVNQSTDTVSARDNTRDNILGLQQGHRYRFVVHVKGHSTNDFSGGTFGWTNNQGWGGGGVYPSPTSIVAKGIPTNFEGETDLVYEFTISDSIFKTCTSAYSAYSAGTEYLSYRHLCVGWGYRDTGNGTVIMFSNFRLYDITDKEPVLKFQKNGVIETTQFIETDNNKAQLMKANAVFGTSLKEE